MLQQPPGGPPSTSLSLVVAAARHAASTPQGARRRCLQHQWSPLPEISTEALRGPTINVSSFACGRYRTCRQHPLGGPPSTSSTMVVAAVRNPDSTPQGAHRVDVCLNMVPAARIFLATPTRGPTVVNITTTSKATSRKSEG
jgi:hypothetical protein